MINKLYSLRSLSFNVFRDTRIDAPELMRNSVHGHTYIRSHLLPTNHEFNIMTVPYPLSTSLPLIENLPILLRNPDQRIHGIKIYPHQPTHSSPKRTPNIPILLPKSIAVNNCTLKSSFTFPRISTAFVGCKCESYSQTRFECSAGTAGQGGLHD
jgi:hypothetical protein